ncbi:Hypothetical protein YoeC [Bacillus subtilis subsp. subtilis str. BSP1]|nr:Hypothetical protein YoeC [Bacillus subtilis subsp. subtilis str. BSP1]
MHIVQPIRSLEKIQEVKQYLLNKNKRDYFLFIFGINSALRISDILPLQVKDVQNKDHLWATESQNEKEKKDSYFRIAETGNIRVYKRHEGKRISF